MKPTTIWDPASAAVTFVNQLSQEIGEFEGPFRRTETRTIVSVPVSIQPLSDGLNPTGTDVYAITRDMCSSGIGVYHNETFAEEFVQITAETFNGDRASVVGQIRYTHQVGHFYHSGIQFLFGTAE